ncbi:DedA family protein [Acidithiobacillus ferrivorans]|uniref:DedA family protein n=1 Tax=Acidithiobacillus ferrivorans TaxID=160808 RepID=A0A7T4WCD2_9PROT|nr:DedA family protein [Acidithiobacillus ferrivorans]QQD72014.1 DedA family protein [Acidithiobacillus ferrivorans]
MNIPPFLLSATHTALPIIHRYGLWVISGAIFLDSFGVIFMLGESILVAAGFLARYGALSIWLPIPMTVIAATLGNYGAYGLGSRFSHLIPLRWGRWIGITAPRLEKTACFFKRHSPVAVMLGRFIVPLRNCRVMWQTVPRWVFGASHGGAYWVPWLGSLYAARWLVGSGIFTSGVRKKGHLDPIESNLPESAV